MVAVAEAATHTKTIYETTCSHFSGQGYFLPRFECLTMHQVFRVVFASDTSSRQKFRFEILRLKFLGRTVGG